MVLGFDVFIFVWLVLKFIECKVYNRPLGLWRKQIILTLTSRVTEQFHTNEDTFSILKIVYFVCM